MSNSMGTNTPEKEAEEAPEGCLMDLVFGLVNLVGFGIAFFVLKFLLQTAGASAYATTLGNFEIAGIMCLVAIVSALFVMLSAGIFRVKSDAAQRKTFWLSGIWIPIGLAGTLLFVGRAIGIIIGLVHSGEQPPQFILWLFQNIDILKELGQ